MVLARHFKPEKEEKVDFSLYTNQFGLSPESTILLSIIIHCLAAL